MKVFYLNLIIFVFLANSFAIAQKNAVKAELEKLFFNLPLDSTIKYLSFKIKDNPFVELSLEKKFAQMNGINSKDYLETSFSRHNFLENLGFHNIFTITNRDKNFPKKSLFYKYFHKSKNMKLREFHISLDYKKEKKDELYHQLNSLLKKFKNFSNRVKIVKTLGVNQELVRHLFLFKKYSGVPPLEIREVRSFHNSAPDYSIFTLTIIYYLPQ
jgi:hypothetical protein